MNLPLEISQRVLDEHASPADKSATRVIILSVSNNGPFRLTGRKRKYILTRDNVAGGHILDVPDSLWQHDVPPGPYRDNLSICHDLYGNSIPLIFIRVPYGRNEAEPEAEKDRVEDPDVTTKLIAAYLREIKAPPVVINMVDKIIDDPGKFAANLTDTDPPEGDIKSDEPEPSAPAPQAGPRVVTGISASPPVVLLPPGNGALVAGSVTNHAGVAIDGSEEAPGPSTAPETAPKPPGPAPTSDSPAAIRMREQRAQKAAAKKAEKLQPQS